VLAQRVLALPLHSHLASLTFVSCGLSNKVVVSTCYYANTRWWYVLELVIVLIQGGGITSSSLLVLQDSPLPSPRKLWSSPVILWLVIVRVGARVVVCVHARVVPGGGLRVISW
jgi:hypothetical protein